MHSAQPFSAAGRARAGGGRAAPTPIQGGGRLVDGLQWGRRRQLTKRRSHCHSQRTGKRRKSCRRRG
eukprot:2762775-Alexandrium_andersonii.AAC.1